MILGKVANETFIKENIQKLGKNGQILWCLNSFSLPSQLNEVENLFQIAPAKHIGLPLPFTLSKRIFF